VDDGEVTTAVSTPEEYVAALAEPRRTTVAAVRDLVNAHLPEGYVEAMDYGMISWVVPLEEFAATHNGKPLCYAALASQKHYVSLYLMGLYTDGPELGRFRAGYAERGRRLDMGKSCLRFKAVEDLETDLVGEAVAAIPVGEFVARYEAARAR
jgi:hypothetical protein